MLSEILGVEIPLFPQMSLDEIEIRIEQEECAYLGKIAFLNNQISLEDYFDILELCEVGMDEYLINLESSIKTIDV